MGHLIAKYALLIVAGAPFVYYFLSLFSSWRYFLSGENAVDPHSTYTPPVSILKPVRGLDPDAYENFASFCKQDYSAYEILFCVGDASDPVVPVIEKLAMDFPEHDIRLLYGSGRDATNDKVAKLARLTQEARYDTLVINDSDVRAESSYLRKVVAPLANPNVGAVTCFYVPTHETSVVQQLQSVGMLSDFYPGILVAWLLDGVKFALGPTIATTRERIAGFGGFEAIENRPGDDLLVGRLIAEQGYEVKLLRYWIDTVADFHSMRDLVLKRLRWMTVMRHMRPWGHFGLLFTLGLPWAIIAGLAAHSARVGLAYLGIYFFMRIAMTWLIGSWGLKQLFHLRYLLLIPAWDALAVGIWLRSFTRKTISWRNHEYYIRDGELVPVRAAAD
jgi:ceramide glucosyltransferase